MSEQFKLLGTFPNDDHTFQALAVLNQQNILHKLNRVPILGQDPSYTPDVALSDFLLEVYISSTQFDQAYQLLLEQGLFTEPEDESDNNALNSYANKELLEIMVSDDWADVFKIQATEILKQRGIELEDSEKERLKQAKKAAAIPPKKAPTKADKRKQILLIIASSIAWILFILYKFLR